MVVRRHHGIGWRSPLHSRQRPCSDSAVVLQTTVGYGDKAPVTQGGRCLGFLWCDPRGRIAAALSKNSTQGRGSHTVPGDKCRMLLGLMLFSTLSGLISSRLTSEAVKQELQSKYIRSLSDLLLENRICVSGGAYHAFLLESGYPEERILALPGAPVESCYLELYLGNVSLVAPTPMLDDTRINTL